jgi:Fic family protein
MGPHQSSYQPSDPFHGTSGLPISPHAARVLWDASVLEGNPLTFPEVKTLMDGVTVGGRKVSDQEQVLNLAESSKHLLALVKSGKFLLNKSTFTEIHALVAAKEFLEWGHFRGEGAEKNYTPDVALGEQGRFTPLPTIDNAA